MTRGSMRSVLRRRLNEQTPHNWQDTELNELLNEAAFWAQRQVLRLNPLAFLAWFRTGLVANESFYKRPVGSWWEFEVAVKETAGATTYTPIDRGAYKAIRTLERGQTGRWAKMGTFLALFPASVENIPDGLQIIHTPLLSMSEDTDVIDLHLSLHMMVVAQANLFALMERPETPAKNDVKVELKGYLDDMPYVYGRDSVDGVDRLWIPSDILGRDSEDPIVR